MTVELFFELIPKQKGVRMKKDDASIIFSVCVYGTLTKMNKTKVKLPDGENLAKVKVHVIDLSNKDGCHSLVEGGAVHVDGGAHREDETCHSFIHVVVLFQTAEGDGQGSRAAGTQRWSIMS